MIQNVKIKYNSIDCEHGVTKLMLFMDRKVLSALTPHVDRGGDIQIPEGKREPGQV